MRQKPVPRPVPTRSVPKIVPTCSQLRHFPSSDQFPACSCSVPATIAADLFPPTPSREGTGNRSVPVDIGELVEVQTGHVKIEVVGDCIRGPVLTRPEGMKGWTPFLTQLLNTCKNRPPKRTSTLHPFRISTPESTQRRA